MCQYRPCYFCSVLAWGHLYGKTCCGDCITEGRTTNVTGSFPDISITPGTLKMLAEHMGNIMSKKMQEANDKFNTLQP